ncbi:MAG: ABC-2 transporter permease [Clostridia bacterium]|jgi:hypothetical protein|nr:ABC-2 transporter permease [Clostridia bacterium]
MGNIQNAVKLDFYIVKSIYRMAVLTYLISILFGIIAQPIIPIFLIMVFGVFFSGMVFSVYEKNHLNKLYGILSLRKSDVIIGRYLYAFLFGIVQASLAGIISYIIFRTTETVVDNFALTTALSLSFIYFCFAVGLAFPIYFKFGFSKAYVFTMIPLYFIFIGAVFLSDKINALNILKSILLYFSGHQVMFLLSGICIGLILFVISGILSYLVYKNSEL